MKNKNEESPATILAVKKKDILARLQALSATIATYGDGEKVHYGHVGSLAHVQDELRNLAEMFNVK